jgi:hypothetical protein
LLFYGNNGYANALHYYLYTFIACLVSRLIAYQCTMWQNAVEYVRHHVLYV